MFVKLIFPFFQGDGVELLHVIVMVCMVMCFKYVLGKFFFIYIVWNTFFLYVYVSKGTINVSCSVCYFLCIREVIVFILLSLL